MRIVERGPVRATLEVSRQGRDSRIVQRISLAAGEAGRRIEVDNRIDWQSTGVSLKAAFPLAAANPEASYSLNTAVVERGNNDSLKFEVPSREWFDLTDRSGRFGVSVLEDCRYGSDKPDDNTLRLTLMYTPEANVPRFTYQATQDFGIHDVKYALYGHEGGWDNGTPWQAKFLNQPLLTFATERHDGDRGRRIALAVPSTGQIDIMAFKKMEEGSYYIVRVNELFGKACDGAIRRHVRPGETCAGTTSARIRRRYSERRCGPQRRTHGTLGADSAGRDASRYDHERRDRFRDPRP